MDSQTSLRRMLGGLAGSESECNEPVMVDRLARNTLASQIATELEIGGQFVRHVDPEDVDHIALIRSAGRQAGRILGWKVRTFQSDPSARADGKVVVIVAAIETPAQDDARFQAQGNAILMDFMKRWPDASSSEA